MIRSRAPRETMDSYTDDYGAQVEPKEISRRSSVGDSGVVAAAPVLLGVRRINRVDSVLPERSPSLSQRSHS